ncbi:MAG: hypothetical protein M1830_007967 [Pleopsidium flavum]|nr:MAG: hypothetical protein M1830_007967 [Pleopsidium flavum]
MTFKADDILRRPLYVFDLPPELLATLHRKDVASLASAPSERASSSSDGKFSEKENNPDGTIAASTSCALCDVAFSNVAEQRSHVRSDFHGYNLKQRLKGLKTVDETGFDRLIGDLDESISGSDSNSDSDEETSENPKAKDDTLTALLRKQANISNTTSTDVAAPVKRKRGVGTLPLLWFTTPVLPPNTSLGIYKAIFTDTEQDEEIQIVDILRNKQLSPTRTLDASNGVPLPSLMTSPHIFLCMIGGGHFAAMVVSLAPKVGKKITGADERQATVLAHKTFHRYTTRRKQGGAQSANDSAKGAAHSAGSSLRRYNEAALESEIRALLREWKGMIDSSQLVFVRATGSTNRRTLFGPYDGQVLRHNDPRNRSFPFSTRRATQAELMRAFVELTRVKVSQVDQEALAAVAAAEAQSAISLPRKEIPSGRPVQLRLSKEEETASLHTSQLQAQIRRSKAPAVLSYLTTNSLSPDFHFHPTSSQQNHHAPTPLHLAASTNSTAVVLALLSKAGVNPETLNSEGKPAFDLAGDRATRDAFRVARQELGEKRWDWAASHVPLPLTKTEADRREEHERQEVDQAEAARRMVETERLAKEVSLSGSGQQGKKLTGKTLSALDKTGAERREEEARGMSPEMRARLERERRARAAEERMRRMQVGGAAGR